MCCTQKWIGVFIRYNLKSFEVYLDSQFQNAFLKLDESEIVNISKRQIDLDDKNCFSVFYKDKHIINNVLELCLKAPSRADCDKWLRELHINYEIRLYEFNNNSENNCVLLRDYVKGHRTKPKEMLIHVTCLEYLRIKIIKMDFLRKLKIYSNNVKKKSIKSIPNKENKERKVK